VNHTTIARVSNKAVQALWPDGAKIGEVLLLVTDAPSCMKIAAEVLSMSYPKPMHTSCIVLALYRACETIHMIYPSVGKLVVNGKKIFAQSPAKTELSLEAKLHI
jgi:hypothetical protein